MKIFKNSTTLAMLMIAFTLIFNSFDTSACQYKPIKPIKPIKNELKCPGKPAKTNSPETKSNDVGAPLDGGLLTFILGGAGAAYFVRKKRNNVK